MLYLSNFVLNLKLYKQEFRSVELAFGELFEFDFNLNVQASFIFIAVQHMQCSGLLLTSAIYLIDRSYESSAIAVGLDLVYPMLSSFKELMAAT